MLVLPPDSALKAQLLCELATLRAETEAKRQRYAQLQACNQRKAALAQAFDREIECLTRRQQGANAFPSGLFPGLSTESQEVVASIAKSTASIACLEETCRGLAQGLANTLLNLEAKTQEAWRLVRAHSSVLEELKGRCLRTTIEEKLCGKCVAGIRGKRTVSSTMKESTAPSSRSRMPQAQVCEACSLL